MQPTGGEAVGDMFMTEIFHVSGTFIRELNLEKNRKRKKQSEMSSVHYTCVFPLAFSFFLRLIEQSAAAADFFAGFSIAITAPYCVVYSRLRLSRGRLPWHLDSMYMQL